MPPSTKEKMKTPRMKSDPERMDRSRPRAVVYHATDAPDGLMVYSEKKQDWLNNGYVKSPAEFGQNQEPIVIETKKEEIPSDDASDLSDYLNEKYGLETNFRMGLKKLKQILKEKQNDDSAEDN